TVASKVAFLRWIERWTEAPGPFLASLLNRSQGFLIAVPSSAVITSRGRSPARAAGPRAITSPRITPLAGGGSSSRRTRGGRSRTRAPKDARAAGRDAVPCELGEARREDGSS